MREIGCGERVVNVGARQPHQRFHLSGMRGPTSHAIGQKSCPSMRIAIKSAQQGAPRIMPQHFNVKAALIKELGSSRTNHDAARICPSGIADARGFRTRRIGPPWGRSARLNLERVLVVSTVGHIRRAEQANALGVILRGSQPLSRLPSIAAFVVPQLAWALRLRGQP